MHFWPRLFLNLDYFCTFSITEPNLNLILTLMLTRCLLLKWNTQPNAKCMLIRHNACGTTKCVLLLKQNAWGMHRHFIQKVESASKTCTLPCVPALFPSYLPACLPACLPTSLPACPPHPLARLPAIQLANRLAMQDYW